MGGRVTGCRAGSKLLLPVILLLFISLIACDTDLRDQIELFVQVKNSGIVYVDGDTGNDDSPGTPELPKKTIQKAIDLAAGLLERGKVYIAKGIYILDETLQVREGISIYGGFAPDNNWERDSASNPTILQGSNIDTVIKPEAGVTPATVIDGFEIKAALETTAACIWCRNSSPTIRFNTLDAANGINSSIGIFNQFCSPVIIANTINAGQGSDIARGIFNEGAYPQIWSNVIFGSGSNGKYKGIYNNNSDAVIQNNTIRCGLSAGDGGIYNIASNCVIENNILFSSGTSCGIQQVSTAALPVRVNNNDFSKCSPVYKHSTGVCDDVGAMETYLDDKSVPYEGNLDHSPLFAGAMDWHLQDGSSLKFAGLDLSASFTIDRDGLPRTNLWSIGAYEKD